MNHSNTISCNNKNPVYDKSNFIATTALLIGDVVLGAYSNIWFGAILRGDVNFIKVGEYTNIQDQVMVHGTYQKASVDIGSYVSIGHRAIIHGCQIEDYSLIGMGAIVMDHALVKSKCLIAAGAIVKENMVCESHYIYAGNPARKIKKINQQQHQMLELLPLRYVQYAQWYA